MRDVALGIKPLWVACPQEVISAQAGLGDATQRAMIKDKIDDIRMKGYIGPGMCVATMNYFGVGKGETDIRMVYDGTKRGLNRCLYAPWFPLPDMSNLIRCLDNGYFCIDNDYGEMFLNFWLHPDLRPYSGMDLTPLYHKPSKTANLLLEVWTKNPMGQSPSPYGSIQQAR
jgi:hypothetical protein